MKRAWDLCNINKHTNIDIMGVPDKKEKQKRTESKFEVIMGKNFQNLIKDMKLQA